MQTQEFSPLKVFHVILTRWWVIVLSAVIGGSFGLIFHYFHPASYEAVAIVSVSMNFPTNGAFSQYDEDYAFGAAAEVIYPPALAQEVVDAVHAQGYDLTVEDFVSGAFLEKKQSIWEFRVRNPDPEIAVKAASVWASRAFAHLEEARSHALEADSLSLQLLVLQNCLNYSADSASTPVMLDTVCNPSSLQSVQRSFDETVARLAEEKALSRGIISVLVFDYSESAYIPVHRVAYDRNQLVLAGASIGFILSLWLVNIIKVQRRG